MVDTSAATSQMTLMAVVLFGCVGGLLPEVLKLVRKLQGKQLPDLYEIVISLILIALGGALAGIRWEQIRSIEAAVAVGATAPSLVGAWMSGAPAPPNQRDGGGASRGLGDGPARGQRTVLSNIGRALSWQPRR